MSYDTELREWESNVQANSTDRPLLPTGFTENARMSIGQIMDENLSISEWIVRTTGGFSYSERDEELKELRKSGQITDEEWINYTRPSWNDIYPMTDYDGLAQFANEKLGTSIRTNAEIDDTMRQTLKERKAVAESVFERQTGMGAVGEVAGGFVGYGIEPAAALGIAGESLLLTRSAFALSEATTRLGRAVITGKHAATAGALSEAAIQPILFNWHEEIGVDMTWSDALLNIASVGILSGVMGAGAGALSQRMELGTMTAEDVTQIMSRLHKEAVDLGESQEVQEVISYAQQELASVEKTANAKEHFERVDDTQKKINEEKIDAPPEEALSETADITDANLDREIEMMIAGGREPLAMFQGTSGDMDFGKLTEYEMRLNEKADIIKSCIGG